MSGAKDAALVGVQAELAELVKCRFWQAFPS